MTAIYVFKGKIVKTSGSM